jgi:hypothetical protein
MAGREQPKVRTATDVIKLLGGPTAVAAWLGLDQSTVSGWGARGEIGRGWRLHVYWSLRDRGYRENEIPAKAFGVTDWKQIIMPKCRKSRKRAA